MNPDKAHKVHLDNNLLTFLVPGVTFAALLIVVFKQLFPRPGVTIRPGQFLDRTRNHSTHPRQTCMAALPGMTVSRPVPVRRLRIVHPHNPPGINPLGDSHRLIRRVRLRQCLLIAANAHRQPQGPDAYRKANHPYYISLPGKADLRLPKRNRPRA